MAIFQNIQFQVEAVQYINDVITGEGQEAAFNWAVSEGMQVAYYDGNYHVETAFGPERLIPGDWIVHYPDGSWAPVRPEKFTATFEEVPA